MFDAMHNCIDNYFTLLTQCNYFNALISDVIDDIDNYFNILLFDVTDNYIDNHFNASLFGVIDNDIDYFNVLLFDVNANCIGDHLDVLKSAQAIWHCFRHLFFLLSFQLLG